MQQRTCRSSPIDCLSLNYCTSAEGCIFSTYDVISGAQGGEGFSMLLPHLHYTCNATSTVIRLAVHATTVIIDNTRVTKSG